VSALSRSLSLAAALTIALTLPAIAEHWQPKAGASFSIVLSVAPSRVTTSADVVDLDLFETKAPVVAALKRQGKRVICYFSAGSWENWRSDKDKFPTAVKGKPIPGWPGERYVDIRNIAMLGPVMKARLSLCKQKGFDAADPDNVDVYEADSGFPLTKADAIKYMRFLAREAHARGLGIGLKNATSIAPQILDVMDFAVTEDCFEQGWCNVSKNFIDADKPVFAIEYTDNHISFPTFCRQAKRIGLSPLLKTRNLDEREWRCP
jgi:hypothetical protein